MQVSFISLPLLRKGATKGPWNKQLYHIFIIMNCKHILQHGPGLKRAVNGRIKSAVTHHLRSKLMDLL